MGGAWHRVSVKCLQLFLLILLLVVLVQSHRHVLLCNPMDCSTTGLPVPHYLPKFPQVHVHCIGDAIQPAISSADVLFFFPSIFPSIRDFSNESTVHIRWPNIPEFQLQHHSSNKCSGLISLKTDWFDFLVVQGSLRSLLQHHSSKVSICMDVSPIDSVFLECPDW